ncbi:hypothetical protein M408DRAFT_326821 [Serendipita vermifera MAFF 305830]|uniref:Uncharacterized protein n=1 Tax=Serendipita vermifera MAFF 305830 TaxID=933852 RepID=A0A0C2XTF6_SERVB|nr:hypothetical protein M408DRAFT_326821 [Serendipita vermifera MAFF 305830]
MANTNPPEQPFEPPPAKFYINKSSDFNYLIQKWATRGWQNGCMAGLPLLVILSRRRFFKPTKSLLERTLQSTWMAGTAGSITGVGLGFARYRGMDKHELRRKRVELQFAEKNLRRDGLATIGGGLTAVLVTAMFWNHASLINLVLGGSGIGTIAGVASALVMSQQEAPGVTDSTDTREKEAAVRAGIVKPGE